MFWCSDPVDKQMTHQDIEHKWYTGDCPFHTFEENVERLLWHWARYIEGVGPMPNSRMSHGYIITSASGEALLKGAVRVNPLK